MYLGIILIFSHSSCRRRFSASLCFFTSMTQKIIRMVKLMIKIEHRKTNRKSKEIELLKKKFDKGKFSWWRAMPRIRGENGAGHGQGSIAPSPPPQKIWPGRKRDNKVGGVKRRKFWGGWRKTYFRSPGRPRPVLTPN